MSYIIKRYFGHVVYGTTQFKRFSNINITKMLGKGNAIFNFIVYFTQVKALVLCLWSTQKQATTNGLKFS